MELIEKEGDILLVLSFAAFRDLILANRLKPEEGEVRGLTSCHNPNPLIE